MFLGDFFILHIQNQKESPKTSISEPMVLSMVFPTRVVLVTMNSISNHSDHGNGHNLPI